MIERNENGKNILITLLVIIVMLLIGFIAFNLGKGNSNVENNGDNDIVDQGGKNNDTTENVIVETGIDYSYSSKEFIQYLSTMKNFPIDMKIPQITSVKEGATNLNEKILVETILTTDGHKDFFVRLMSSNGDMYYEGTNTTYDYEIKNNIIAIYVLVTDKDGDDSWPGSGTARKVANYFYDIKNDKEIESIIEALPLMGYTTDDLKKFDITSFSELTENESTAYYKIENGKGEIIFEDCRQGCI